MFKIIFILLTLLFPSPLYGRTESNLIKVIIKDVLKKVNKLLVEIEKKYEEPRPKGGIGKTTLAEDLYAKAKHSVKKATSLSISCSTTKPYLKVYSKINIP
jgi:hypothetical protein